MAPPLDALSRFGYALLSMMLLTCGEIESVLVHDY